MEAANCQVTDTRRLSWYSLKYIVTKPARTRLLSLVCVDEDDNQFASKGRKVDSQQNLPRRTIWGKEYYQLQCSLEDVLDHELATSGAQAGMYTQKQFENDLKRGNGGFRVKFMGGGSSLQLEADRAQPFNLMFFGNPLSMSRSYDLVFKSVSTLLSFHHRFILYYDHMEGDIAACLCLYNSYLAKQMALLESNTKKKEVKEKTYDGSIFTSPRCVTFCTKFDDHCTEAIKSVLTMFHNHLEPIIRTPTMKVFIAARGPGIHTVMTELRSR